MLQKIKSKTLEKSTNLWLVYQNARGGQLIENKVLMILAIVMIFGLGGLAIAWLKDYWAGVSTDIQNNGGVNNNFGGSVNW